MKIKIVCLFICLFVFCTSSFALNREYIKQQYDLIAEGVIVDVEYLETDRGFLSSLSFKTILTFKDGRVKIFNSHFDIVLNKPVEIYRKHWCIICLEKK
jgi:hypothetical protein